MSPAAPATDSPQAVGDDELMARHGITCVLVPQYHYKSWRYARLGDAVAQARRELAAASAPA